MKLLSVFTDSAADADRLRWQLTGIFETRFLRPAQIPETVPGQYTVIDFDLKDASRLHDLKEWMRSRPRDGKVIFAIDKTSRIDTARANALGATDVIDRPVNGRALLHILSYEVVSPTRQRSSQGVAAAVDGMGALFSAASVGEPVKPEALNVASAAVVSEIKSLGLSSWIETVRKHHSQTYQHCLLVTGLAVAFGQHLGLSRSDRNRLSFAGMLHDIGKARIPVTILEKPGPLDSDELAVMRQHPQLGLEALQNAPALQPEMIDMVVHHHEYLDGSGYPHGLQTTEISDLVRMMTIADIFGALIERRSYKPPLSGGKAYDILREMGPKLDKDLVREFGFAAKAV